MKMFQVIFLLSCYPLLCLAIIKPIKVIDNRFFAEGSSDPFIVNGIAYQPTLNGQYQDVISDDMESFWKQDISFFKTLGINTLRVYEVDSDKSHDKFMNSLADMGIYAMFDLQSSKRSVNRNDPSYDVEYFEFIAKKMDHLSKYTNTLAFIIGNEVANEPGITTRADAYIKAALRDLKRFRELKGLRKIPIGYAAADDDIIRLNEAQYFICDADGFEGTPIDFYGLNIYSWCGDSSIDISGYRDRMKEFSGYPVPVLFTEYGCNTVEPRKFTEVGALFGEMLTVFSGAIAYEYSQEVSNYGLVEISNGGIRKELPDFVTLQSQLSNVSIKVPKEQKRLKSESSWSSSCPKATDEWQINGDKLPPVASRSACECLDKQMPCIASVSTATDDDHVRDKELGDLISKICDLDEKHCQDLDPGNAQSGTFGQWSICPAITKLSFATSQHQPDTCRLESQYFSVSKSARNQRNDKECANMPVFVKTSDANLNMFQPMVPIFLTFLLNRIYS